MGGPWAGERRRCAAGRGCWFWRLRRRAGRRRRKGCCCGWLSSFSPYFSGGVAVSVCVCVWVGREGWVGGWDGHGEASLCAREEEGRQGRRSTHKKTPGPAAGHTRAHENKGHNPAGGPGGSRSTASASGVGWEGRRAGGRAPGGKAWSMVYTHLSHQASLQVVNFCMACRNGTRSPHPHKATAARRCTLPVGVEGEQGQGEGVGWGGSRKRGPWSLREVEASAFVVVSRVPSGFHLVPPCAKRRCGVVGWGRRNRGEMASSTTRVHCVGVVPRTRGGRSALCGRALASRGGASPHDRSRTIPRHHRSSYVLGAVPPSPVRRSGNRPTHPTQPRNPTHAPTQPSPPTQHSNSTSIRPCPSLNRQNRKKKKAPPPFPQVIHHDHPHPARNPPRLRGLAPSAHALAPSPPPRPRRPGENHGVCRRPAQLVAGRVHPPPQPSGGTSRCLGCCCGGRGGRRCCCCCLTYPQLGVSRPSRWQWRRRRRRRRRRTGAG